MYWVYLVLVAGYAVYAVVAVRSAVCSAVDLAVVENNCFDSNGLKQARHMLTVDTAMTAV